MVSFSRLAAVALLALGAQGCFTGHLLEIARQVEQPIAYHDACVDGDRLVIDYTALVTDLHGEPVGRRERRAAIALADLRRDGIPVEAFPVERLPDDSPLRGRHVALVFEADGDGRQTGFAVHEAALDARFHSGALTRAHTAPWVYPILPFTLAVDAVTNPVLLFFAPAVITIGD